MESMSSDEMSSIAGRDGVVIDLNFMANNAVAINSLSFKDATGLGTNGTFSLSGIDIGDAFNDGGDPALNNIQIDADGVTTVGGVSGGALVFQLPSNSDFEIDVDDIYFGNPGVNSGGGLEVDELHFNESVVEVAAKGEGIRADADLKLDASYLDYVDDDGWSGVSSPSPADFRVEDPTLDNGSGGKVNFTGFELDVDGSATVGSSTTSAIVLGIPSESFDVSTGDVLMAGGSRMTSGITMTDVDFSNMSVEVASH